MKRIGIIGCGNIAAVIGAYAIDGNVIAVFDRHRGWADRIAGMLGARAYDDFDAFIDEPFDLVVEIASVEAVRTYAPRILEKRCDLMLLSAGALADPDFRKQLGLQAEKAGRRLLIPSGALFGLDNAKIARLSGTATITMRSTKPPAAFGITASQRRCLFEGAVSECIKQYPRNVNAAVALSLAAEQDIQIELWADPTVTANRHEVRLCGDFGEMTMRVDNKPSPEHPSTSILAAFSVIASLKDSECIVCIGT